MDLSTPTGLADAAFEVVKDDLGTLLGLSEVTTTNVTTRVWSMVMSRFEGKAQPQQALADLTAKPEDESARAAFRAQLAAVLEKEPNFQANLRSVLAKSRGTRGTP